MRDLTFLRSPAFWASLIVIAVLISIPLVVKTTYFIFIFIMIYMFTAMAASWNMCAGYTGIIPFGNIAFFGIGAYTLAIFLIRWGVPPFIGVILGGLAAVLFALLIGYPCLRLRGAYFAIATLGLMHAVEVSAANLRPITGGAIGLSLPVRDPSITPHYYGMFIVALGSVLVTYWLANSRFGLGLLAIREDEDAAEMTGVNTHIYKLTVFAINGFFCGAAGAVWAYYLPYIDHTILFSHDDNIMLIVMAMFGGMGTVLGPPIGASVLVVLSQYLTVSLPGLIARLGTILPVAVARYLDRAVGYLPMLMYGFLLLLMVLFMRGGLMGIFTGLYHRLRAKEE
jgi:branched-chain amino acid transport system permease protein